MPILRLGERLYAAPRPGTVLCCPGCGNGEVGEADRVAATARGEWVVGRSGLRFFDAGGTTDVHWDSQVPYENAPCYCRECYWQGKPNELVTAQRFSELMAIAVADSLPQAIPGATSDLAEPEPAEHVWSGIRCSLCGADEASSFANQPCTGVPF